MADENQTISFSKVLTKSDVQVETTAQLTIPKECGRALFPPEGGMVAVRDTTTGKLWSFRHGINGGPERHRLSTGWSRFVGENRPSVGDTVVFSRNHDGELHIELRRRPPPPQVPRDESGASSGVTAAIPPPLSGESSGAAASRVPLPAGFFQGESSRAAASRARLSEYYSEGESSRAPPAEGESSPIRHSASEEEKRMKRKQRVLRYLRVRAERRRLRRSTPLAGVRGARAEVQPGNPAPGGERRSIRLFGQIIWAGRNGGEDAEDDPSLNLSLAPPGSGHSARGEPRASP